MMIATSKEPSMKCSINNCDREVAYNDMCNAHYLRWLRGKPMYKVIRESLPCPKNHPIHMAWENMKARCRNKNLAQWEDYGGRGIAYDTSWESFSNFYGDMFPTWEQGLTLDRINNDGDYCKENCRWATRAQQQQNSRRSKLTLEQAEEIRNRRGAGESLTNLANEFGVKYHIVADIMRRKTYAK